MIVIDCPSRDKENTLQHQILYLACALSQSLVAVSHLIGDRSIEKFYEDRSRKKELKRRLSNSIRREIKSPTFTPTCLPTGKRLTINNQRLTDNSSDFRRSIAIKDHAVTIVFQYSFILEIGTIDNSCYVLEVISLINLNSMHQY